MVRIETRHGYALGASDSRALPAGPLRSNTAGLLGFGCALEKNEQATIKPTLNQMEGGMNLQPVSLLII